MASRVDAGEMVEINGRKGKHTANMAAIKAGYGSRLRDMTKLKAGGVQGEG